MQYAALLRGINVGGKNLIKMSDLAACFEALGLENVRTYIQSGNVLFRSKDQDEQRLTESIETALAQMFHYDASLVLRSEAEMQAIVGNAPGEFGSDPETYRYNVIFLKEPLTADEVMRQVTLKEGVDQAFAGDGVTYFSNLISRASSSRLSKIISLPIYQYMTIRNWNTTTKLLQMMKAEKI